MLQLMIERSDCVMGVGKAESILLKYKYNNLNIFEEKNDSY